MDDAKLLAIVEVDPADRVVCQAEGCGHSVYKRVHVVSSGGELHVYGSDCYAKLFGGNPAMARPHYGSSDARVLTDAERALLAENTARLIEQFEAERQAELEREAMRAAQRQREEREAGERAAEQQAASECRVEQSRLAAAEAAAHSKAIEAEAKAYVREKYGVDPDAPGWRGLVMARVRELMR
jgi:hypothetical protein